MALLPIITYDDDVLRDEALPVKGDSKELQQLIDDMFDTMYNAKGVGLAAPQVGKRLRLFVTDDANMKKKTTDYTAHGPFAMINPVIRLGSEETVVAEEGCLSIPGVRGDVSRPSDVTVSFKDRSFTERIMRVDGPLARIIQHEFDHLNGVLFIDHLSYFKRKLVAKKLRELAAGQNEVDYPVAEKV
jgi:peptide deformylase